MTGPIIFADERAREQLQEAGRVLTFRTSERTTGATWWRASRTGPKRGDCRVALYRRLAAPMDDFFARHADAAGFDSGDEWRAAIASLNGGVPGAGYVYQVTTR
jgi:hypothetical protein